MTANSPPSDLLLLYVSHDIGGGVQHHTAELRKLFSGKARIATLLSQPGNYVKLSLESHDWYFDQRDQFKDLLNLLKKMQFCALHFHHLSGFLAQFWPLADELQLPYFVTLHDYSLINGASTLCGTDGFFLQDLRLQQQSSAADLPRWCSGLEQWQQLNCELLAKAEQVFCPSRYTLDVYSAHYPQARYRCCFHPDWEREAPYPAVKPALSAGGVLRVGVLGALNRVKGADRLEACAIEAQNQQLEIEFVLFGKAYRRLHDSVKSLGSYQDDQLADLMEQQAIDLVWFPALWAETYSYTLSHCLQQGLPVFAPDIGAFPERLRDRPLSFMFDYRSKVDELLARFAQIRSELHSVREPVCWENQALPQQQEFLYSRDYLEELAVPLARVSYDPSVFSVFEQVPLVLQTSPLRIRLIKGLLKLTNSRLFSLVQKIVPYTLQKRIKRIFTHKPLHEFES